MKFHASPPDLKPSTLVGRGSTHGGGDPHEITLGANLEMIGDILSAAGGSGGPPDPHTHPIADVVNLQVALDGKAPTTHSHVISDVTALQAALDGKSAFVHSHAIADVTGLQNSLDGKALAAHAHIIGDTTGLQAALDGKAATGHTHSLADITNEGALAFLNTVGTGQIDNDSVTYAKMQNVSAISKLLGRGSAAGAGDTEEITLGTNLSMSGTTLNASGGGGAGTDPPEGSYAPGSYTIATEKFRTAVKRQQFTTSQRLTIQGTGRLSIYN